MQKQQNFFYTHRVSVGAAILLLALLFGIAQALPPQFSIRRFISPLSSVRQDALQQLLPRLQQKPNAYRLIKQGGIVGQAAASSNDIDAKAYAVVDFGSGQVIDSKNGDDEIPMASLTKIMTAVVALDISSPDEKFVVTQKAADQIPTKIGVVVGQELTLDELLQAGLMTSANDAIEVIRDGIDTKYQDEVFVRAMNAKAEFLGLKHTHFTNPQGFDNPKHYSSTSDLAVLTHYALTNYPLIAKIVQQDYIQLPSSSDHKQFDLYNWNGLIGVYPNVSGVKIGNTEEAGTTTIVTAERNSKTLLVVVLGTSGVLERDLAAATLLDEGFATTLNLPPVNVTEAQLKAKYATWKYWN